MANYLTLWLIGQYVVICLFHVLDKRWVVALYWGCAAGITIAVYMMGKSQ